MHERRVPIPEPCNVAWGEMGALGAAGRYCEKCQHAVVDLSALTEAQAQRVLNTPNPDICVSYVREASGRIVFRKPALRELNTSSAALGALLSLAACSKPSAPETPIRPEPAATTAQQAWVAETAAPEASNAATSMVVEQALPTTQGSAQGGTALATEPGTASDGVTSSSGSGWPSAQQPGTDGEVCDPPPKPPVTTGPKHPPRVRLAGKPALHHRFDERR